MLAYCKEQQRRRRHRRGRIVVVIEKYLSTKMQMQVQITDNAVRVNTTNFHHQSTIQPTLYRKKLVLWQMSLNDAFQYLLSITLGKVCHVVILWCHLH